MYRREDEDERRRVARLEEQMHEIRQKRIRRFDPEIPILGRIDVLIFYVFCVVMVLWFVFGVRP